jgi:protocatechuate 3,4-dioxygenase, beta subunit
MNQRSRVSRRQLLGHSGAVAAMALLGAASARAAQALRQTPAQTSGPFYPAQKPLDADADLTLIRGHQQRAAGQVVHVMGRVLQPDGRPVAGARIEIWQANTHGRYAHPDDANPAPLDPHFEGYASLLTDAAGRYRFKTIKPGAYPAGNAVRTPHIHFGVTAARRRLTTQMYFPGDSRNDADFVLGATRENRQMLFAELVAPTAELEANALLARWDIVLAGG